MRIEYFTDAKEKRDNIAYSSVIGSISFLVISYFTYEKLKLEYIFKGQKDFIAQRLKDIHNKDPKTENNNTATVTDTGSKSI